MSWHPQERAAVVTALREAGPGAPTLCAGWRTEQLAAHLVLRERDPVAAAGIAFQPLAARTERRTQELGARSTSPAAWEALVGRVAQGPPVWSPLHWGGDAAQLAELFVHTEDVRRGGPHGRRVPTRARAAGHTAALWTALRRMAPLLLRSTPVPLVLTDGEQELRVGPRSEGSTPAMLRGDVGELMLWGYERPGVAHVELEGAPDQVAALEAFRPRS
ncbi:MAG: TIGR03085 family protein [Actinotalea sp.]|nr:TIGR03085 family protein [Actinotalea sp.]